VNCSALPRELIESELFGYRRGAFSGAVTEYMGLFRAAEGGTIFLDEVTEMAAETQSKLLRVLQERTIRPVGSVREIAVNARIVASTNTDPQEALSRGLLREDLYYRLNVNTLYLPPLRDRMEDLALLAEYFVEMFAEKFGCPKKRLSPEAMDIMQRYPWPGNVRELMNAVESAYTFGRGDTIYPSDLPGTITQKSGLPPPSAGSTPLVSTFADTERELIARALEMTGGNKLRAAKLLGISRKKLYAKIAKYG
jgi:transcriptional regulator with PAS, ATPase and Fis domain